MKKLTRGTPPVRLGDDEDMLDKRRKWYADLRNKKGEIKARWNNGDRTGCRPVRESVAALTSGCCAWCGVRLEQGWNVDHYLPKVKFPRLSYCWDALLPSCGDCNRRKHEWHPPTLRIDSLVDPALAGDTEDQVYHPASVLPGIADRLVDPAFDDPAEHLQFEPAVHSYDSRTRTGACTVENLFSDKEFAERSEEIGSHVWILVKLAGSEEDFESVLGSYVATHGREMRVRAYAEHWIEQVRPPWKYPPALAEVAPAVNESLTPSETPTLLDPTSIRK